METLPDAAGAQPDLARSATLRDAALVLASLRGALTIALTASLLRDAGDRPGHFVVVVEDGTELMLRLRDGLQQPRPPDRRAAHGLEPGVPAPAATAAALRAGGGGVGRPGPPHV